MSAKILMKYLMTLFCGEIRCILKKNMNNRMASILVSLLILVEMTSILNASPVEHLQLHHDKQQHHNDHRNMWSRWHMNQFQKNESLIASSLVSHHNRVLHDSLLRSQRSHGIDEARSNYYNVNGPTRTTVSQHNHHDANPLKEETDLAVPEYSGVRAVAIAGYDSNSRETVTSKEDFTYVSAHPTITSTSSYTWHHAGRRVCSRQTPISVNHHPATRRIRFLYTAVDTSSFMCCPGWSQITRTSYGCNRPVCTAPCYNGGICGPHGKCNCPKGFTGSQCQLDVDECLTEKPCAQFCTNLPGSYQCHCRNGFYLAPDRQTCRKNDSDGTAFEARDLENDYGLEISTTGTPVSTSSYDAKNELSNGNVNKDYEIIMKKLIKLEKQFTRKKKKDGEMTELNTKVHEAAEGVAELQLSTKHVLNFLREIFGPIRHEIYDMKNKFEFEQKRIDHLYQRLLELHQLNHQ